MSSHKINVLQFICPTGFYGAERWILALANNSDQAEVRMDLVVTEEGSNQDLEIVNQFTPPQGQAFKLPMSGRFDLSVLRQLKAIIKNRKIDIIHTHGYKSDILGLVAARQSGIRCISTPHGFGEPKTLKHKILVAAGGFSLRFFDAVVPLSRQLYDECINYKVNEQKLHYIQNGVDLSEVETFRSQKSKDMKASDERRIIGFIGQMVARKKIHFILDLFDRLAKTRPNVELRLLGDGSSREELQAYADTLASRNKIQFLGFVNNRLEHLAEFDLFVMTSSSEGIPRCLMEALGMGTPVAAFDIPGIDQLVTHDKTGMLAPYGDIETLFSHWEALLYEPELSQRIGASGRAFVNENFSGKSMADKYYSLFRTLISEGSA